MAELLHCHDTMTSTTQATASLATFATAQTLTWPQKLQALDHLAFLPYVGTEGGDFPGHTPHQDECTPSIQHGCKVPQVPKDPRNMTPGTSAHVDSLSVNPVPANTDQVG